MAERLRALRPSLPWLALALNFAPPVEASDERDPAALVEQHLANREDALTRQTRAAESLARQHAWLAYRLARRRDLGFFADAERRRDHARAADQALVVLHRSLDETSKIRRELALVSEERAALAGTPAKAGGAPGTAPPRMRWPLSGTLVVKPGTRVDQVTGVRLRETGVQILGRVDAQVRAPADARVHRVERLLEGGHALVLAHEGELVTIISGLRKVRVAPDDRVEAGQVVGLVGRTLDGAPVVRVSLFRGATTLDPEAVMKR